MPPRIKIKWTIRTRQAFTARTAKQPPGLWQLGGGGRIETELCLPMEALSRFLAQEGVEPIDGTEYMVTPDNHGFGAIIRAHTSTTLEVVS